MLLYFNGESPCLSKLLEINTALGRNLSLSLQMWWAQATGKWTPHTRSPSPWWGMPTNAAVRSLALAVMWVSHPWWNPELLKSSVVLRQDIAVVTGRGVWEQIWWHNPDYRGCFGAFWYAAHFDVFKNARQAPLRIFCRVFGIYVNLHSCSKVLHTWAVHYVKKCLPLLWISYYLHLTICRSFIGRNTEQLFPTHCLLSLVILLVYSIIWCVLQPEGFYAIFSTFSCINSSVIYLPISVISKHLPAAGNVLALQLGLYGCSSAKRVCSPEWSIQELLTVTSEVKQKNV